MTDKLRFDVVIPAHNAAATIAEAVRSAWAQNHLPTTVTVVADACDDDTAGIARATGANVVEIDARSVAEARNVGASQGLSPWIAFLDADDLWQPTWLESLAKSVVLNPQAVLHFGQVEERTHNGNPVFRKALPKLGPSPVITLLTQNLITTSASAVHRREFLALGGFLRQYSHGEDWELWLRIAESHPVAKVPGVHVTYMRSVNSAMRDPQNFFIARRQALEICTRALHRIHAPEALSRRAISFVYQQSAERLVHHGWTDSARQDLHQALNLTPGDLRLWLLAVLSCLHPTDRHRLLMLRRHLRRWRLPRTRTVPWLPRS